MIMNDMSIINDNSMMKINTVDEYRASIKNQETNSGCS